MKAWECEHCTAEIKQEKKPDSCPICFKRGHFTEIELPEPSEEEKKISEKYEEAIEILDKYEEGTPPRGMQDMTCGCGDHHGKHDPHKHGEKNGKKEN